MDLKLKEALFQASQNGNRVSQKELGQILWPNSSEKTARMNMNCLANGHTLSFKIEWISKICKKLNTTPNKLFGYGE